MSSAARHFVDLLKNKPIQVVGYSLSRTENDDARDVDGDSAKHGGKISSEFTKSNATRGFHREIMIDESMLRFTKMNGAGNDFVVIDNRTGDVRLNSKQIVRICDRHRGLGAHEVLLRGKAATGADFRIPSY